MSVTMSPYLNFAGNTGEAMAFYHSIFGGELAITTFGEAAIDDLPAEGVMHAALVTESFTIMASDAMPGAEATWGGTRNYINLNGTDAELLAPGSPNWLKEGPSGCPSKPNPGAQHLACVWTSTASNGWSTSIRVDHSCG